ncbi:DUF3618 domain-containing protein [Sphingomonas sp. PAMC 26621]|uniref:DUF3618 domain-containing protein n=1 Tax=Sphingomonas sp. PAMC 26621 TaxID=1112213 RepID=UPI0002897993|nr:DUF3618 domain-containing protein [Sphingomonas sp. PAMC 26621]
MSTTDSVALAQARANAARAQLADTIGILQKRANPQTLASDVAENLKVRGTEAVTTAVETARKNPVATGIVGAVLGSFLVVGPVSRLLRGRKPAKSKLKR